MKFVFYVLAVFCLMVLSAQAQSIEQFHLYSYDHSLFNPAAAGAENKHVLGINGQMDYNRYSNSSHFYTGAVSYNGNLSKIKSGIGVLALMDVFGHTTSKLGFSYNYKLNLTLKTSVRFGLRPTISKLFIDNSNEKATTKPDLDLGIWVNMGDFYSGASVINTFSHKHSIGDAFGNQIDAQSNVIQNARIGLKINNAFSEQALTLLVGRKIKIAALQFDPSLAFIKAGNASQFFLNTNFTLKEIIILGGTYTREVNSNWYKFGINGGLNLFNKFQIIGLLYTKSLYSSHIHRNRTFFEGMMRVKI